MNLARVCRWLSVAIAGVVVYSTLATPAQAGPWRRPYRGRFVAGPRYVMPRPGWGVQAAAPRAIYAPIPQYRVAPNRFPMFPQRGGYLVPSRPYTPPMI